MKHFETRPKPHACLCLKLPNLECQTFAQLLEVEGISLGCLIQFHLGIILYLSFRQGHIMRLEINTGIKFEGSFCAVLLAIN